MSTISPLLARPQTIKRETIDLLLPNDAFRILVEAVSDYAIFILDVDGYISTWNLGAERIKGYKAAEIIGQHFSQFYPAEAIQAGLPQQELAIATSHGRFEAEGWRLRRDGSRFWANVIVTPMRDSHQKLVGFAKVTRDLTERRLAEQIAIEARARTLAAEKTLVAELKAIRLMSGALAHEISNPLAIIHAKASLLKDTALAKATIASNEVQEACDAVIKTADRASRILRSLRGFAREGSRDNMELASMYEIVEEGLSLQKGRFDLQRIDLRLKVTRDIPLLWCREVQIGQILTNLLNNAFDAITQANSTERWVLVSLEVCKGYIHLDVIDSGPGVKEKNKTHLMEPFFSTKEFELGMGLGLSLSRAIAQDHGGTLTLCEGKRNTCFRLVLPHAPVVVTQMLEGSISWGATSI